MLQDLARPDTNLNMDPHLDRVNFNKSNEIYRAIMKLL